MSPNLFEPRRLRESPQRSSSVEGRLARQLRVLSVFAPTPQLRRYSLVPRRRRYILTAVRLAVAVTLLLVVSGVATAMAAYVVRRVWPSPTTVDFASVDNLRTPPAKSAGKHRGRVAELSKNSVLDSQSLTEPGGGPDEPAVAVAAVASSADQPFAEPPVPPPKPRLVGAKHSDDRPTQTHQPPKATPPTPIQPAALPSLPLPTATPAVSQVQTDGVTLEAGLLRQALFALRRDHDGKRALALLDDYDRRFAQGALTLEATSTRAQALLQLGDNVRALELLERLPLSREGHTGELRVIRGELRSLSGRCRDALSDFDAVLRPRAGNAPDELARALFGRASCRARTGDLAGAEEDRQRYLKEFPRGPAARQLLSPP